MTQQDLQSTVDGGPDRSNVDEVLGNAGLPVRKRRRDRSGLETRPGRASRVIGDYGVLIFLLLMIVFFSVALPSKFPNWSNAQSILGDQAIPGMLALAVVLPLAAGEFDLSVAASLGFSAVLSGWLMGKGVPVTLAIVLCVAIGVVIGAVNAALVVGVGINAFIATLGTSTILAGGNLLVTNGATIFSGIPQSFLNISQQTIVGLPLAFFYLVALAVLLWYLIEHTPFGRYLRVTGQGREAARLSGVPTSRYLSLAFILAGALGSLCGVLELSWTGSATSSIGPEFLLPAYAAAFLGATTIHRGRFNVWGAIVGVFVLAVGITGLQLWGAPFWVPDVFNGTALILAVSVAAILGRGRGDSI